MVELDAIAHVGMPRQLRDRIAELAEEHQRSIAGEIRFALGLYVRQYDQRRTSPTSAPGAMT